MIRPIMKDTLFLAQPSEEATPADLPVLMDLLDTLRAHQERCAGMAANMIGVKKRIIAFYMGQMPFGMINPVIVDKKAPYQTEEGCLSLAGKRPTVRYRKIDVKYLDPSFQQQTMSCTGWTAQVIQHEIDHCNGILI